MLAAIYSAQSKPWLVGFERARSAPESLLALTVCTYYSSMYCTVDPSSSKSTKKTLLFSAIHLSVRVMVDMVRHVTGTDRVKSEIRSIT